MSELTPNILQAGMKFLHPSMMKNHQYPLLVNGNINGFTSSFLKLQNEPSNLLCSRFKDGYKVIGLQPVISLNLTFYFLVNPLTNKSEIGYIYNSFNQDSEDRTINCKECNNVTEPDTPLELQDQIDTCTYNTYVNADCLNFNYDFPIRSWVKIDDCNTRIYFVDSFNDIRYINFDDFQKEELANCPKVESDELDCNKIKLFPDTCYPTIDYVDIVTGGQNTAGVYQFAMAYADANGNNLTKYFYVTNPIPLGDRPIITDGNEAYPVAKSIKLHIENISPDFDFINLVVLKTTEGNTTPYLVANLSNTGDELDYVYSGIDKNILADISIDQIFQRKPVYKSAESITESNGIVILGGLTENRTLNLQPVINKLTLNWQTVELDEGAYKNPIIAANYRSNLRDEVYPYAIEFVNQDQTTTARFHIPGRTANSVDLQEIPLSNPDVIKDSLCTDETPNLRWEVYNTANPSGYACGYTPNSNGEITLSDYITCGSYIYEEGSSINPSGLCLISPDSDEICIDSYIDNYPTIVGSPILLSSEVIIVTPAGTKEVCEYEEEGDIDVPPIPATFPTPTNLSCTTANYFPLSTDDNCFSASTGVYTYGYLNSASNTTAATNCTLNSCFDNNQVWYQFVPTSEVMTIQIGTNTSDIVVQVFSGTCDNLTQIACQVQSGNGVYILLQDLMVGNSYYIKVYNCTPASISPSGYFSICGTIPQPIPDTCVQVPTPAILQVRCQYEIQYTKNILEDNNCAGVPYQYGGMAYWESIEKYPCNQEVWGDLADKPIRHHKFPDFKISPTFSRGNHTEAGAELPDREISDSNDWANIYNTKNKIYPIGVTVDVEQVKQLLLEAQNTGLITEQERLNICGYRILRGNRRGNESIIAKGLAFDVWNYTDNVYQSGDKILYQNYPFNDLNPDEFLSADKIMNKADTVVVDFPLHPYDALGRRNNKYTIMAPNLLFNNPALGSEVKIEAEYYGVAETQKAKVIDHPKYQYVGGGGLTSAFLLASMEADFDVLEVATGGGLIGYISYLIFSGFAWGGVQFKHYGEWLELITKLAPFRNFAKYYVATSNYNDYFIPNEGNIRRFSPDNQYLIPGVNSVKSNGDVFKFNNIKRESTVYLGLETPAVTDFFLPPTINDTSRNIDFRDTGYIYNPISSYYVSVKNNIPSQYGSINSIDYIDTGYNGIIGWDSIQNTQCDTIFGGDTFINRFSDKRKHAYFLNDVVGQQDGSDVIYNELANVWYPRFFFNYPVTTDQGNGAWQLFGNVALLNSSQADYNFANLNSSGSAWIGAGIIGALVGLGAAFGAGSAGGTATAANGAITLIDALVGREVYLNGEFYLYNYGIPSFFVESDYNLDLRYGENTKEKDFYPNAADVINWTQESIVPIAEDNYHFYNNNYSKQNRENFGYILPQDFNQEKEDCKIFHPNRVIYSLQDNDSNDEFDGNLVYLANNFYDFSKNGGNVTIIKGGSNNRVLVVQENTATVFNAYTTLEADIKTVAVGSGALFNNNLQQFLKTDLGYGGSQTSAIISTDFGMFYADNKRGKLFNYFNAIENIIPEEEAQWFKENLPFKLTNYFPEVNINNTYKGIGMIIWWDERFKRVFFTKKDYIPQEEYKDLIEFRDNNFYLKSNNQLISLKDTQYFCNKSWTVAYSPITKTFISFYTFIPDYANTLPEYFQTGINEENTGVYNHLLTSKSYTVFYGEKHPFILEYVSNTQLQNNQLISIEYEADYLRYINTTDSYKANSITYSHALIRNVNQTSGTLKLIPKQKNNMMQFVQYSNGKLLNNELNVLVDNIENIHRINTFYDIAKNNNQPIMKYDCNPMYKELNLDSISWAPTYFKNTLRADWNIIRLEDRETSNYQIIHNFNINQNQKSNI